MPKPGETDRPDQRNTFAASANTHTHREVRSLRLVTGVAAFRSHRVGARQTVRLTINCIRRRGLFCFAFSLLFRTFAVLGVDVPMRSPFIHCFLSLSPVSLRRRLNYLAYHTMPIASSNFHVCLVKYGILELNRTIRQIVNDEQFGVRSSISVDT